MATQFGWRPLFVKQQAILDRRVWVYYLIINEGLGEKLGKTLEAHPEERFFQSLSKHVEAYVRQGTMPPKEIETAVFNAADDFMAGRDVTLRAGDYIALQNYARGGRH